MYTFISRQRMAVAILSAALAVSAGAGPSAAADAVLHYSFEDIENGMVRDLSGNGYHGRIEGEPEKVDSGLRFTGGECVIIPEVDAMNVGVRGFAVEIEFELEEDRPWTVSEEGYGMLLTADYADNPGAWIVYSNIKNRPGKLRFALNERITWSPEPLPVGEPVHIVVSVTEDPRWDTMRREMYVNGRLQRHIARGPLVPLEDNLQIIVGAQQPGKRHFRGVIRELRLYARPVAGEEDPVFKRSRISP